MQYLKYIKNEWDVIVATPFTFIGLFILACIVVYVVAKWRYGKIVEVSKERYNLLKERYDAKSSQLEETINKIKSKELQTKNTKNNTNKESLEIDRIIKKIQALWQKYQKNSKSMWKYGGVVISTKPFTTTPVQFKCVFPKLHQEALKDSESIKVKEFYYKTEDIELIYKELRSHGAKDFELVQQWESLVAELLKQGNPLRSHNTVK